MARAQAEEKRGVVLALGSGGARGIAHLGVIRVLARHGIPVRAVIGSSIGAQIGALLAAGVSVEELLRLACGVDWKTTIRLFMPEFGKGGVIADRGIREFLEPYLGTHEIQSLSIGYAAVAADLASGEEVIIRRGNLLEAVRASISIPGLLRPAIQGARILVDGGLVNPVPFDRARELFGGPVLAVAVHPGAFKFELPGETSVPDWRDRIEDLLRQSVVRKWPQLRKLLDDWDRNGDEEALPDLGASGIYNRAMDISRAQLMRLRLKLAPPDILLTPNVQGIGMLEFYRADEALAAGMREAKAHLAQIKALLRQ